MTNKNEKDQALAVPATPCPTAASQVDMTVAGEVGFGGIAVPTQQVVKQVGPRPMKTQPLDFKKTVRAIFKAVNGGKLQGETACAYLRRLLTELDISVNRGQTICVINFLEETLQENNVPCAELWEVTPDLIGHFKAKLVAADFAPTTIRLYLDLLGHLFEVAKKRKRIRRNVVRKISRPPRPKNSPRRPFTDYELQKICEIADDEWFGMILVALYTGLRIGDVARLVYRDFDLKTKYIRASVKKTKKFEPKPIAPPLEFYFNTIKWPDDLDQPVFPRAYALVSAKKNSALSLQFVRLLVKAGVRAKGVKVHGVLREGAEKYLPLSFQCLRHTHTTMLKKGNIPEAIARQIAGHLSVAISDIYTHLGEDVMLAAVEDLPEVNGVSTYY